MKKVLLIFIVIILGIGWVQVVQAGSEHNVTGWAWSETIGWLLL